MRTFLLAILLPVRILLFVPLIICFSFALALGLEHDWMEAGEYAFGFLAALYCMLLIERIHGSVMKWQPAAQEPFDYDPESLEHAISNHLNH